MKTLYGKAKLSYYCIEPNCKNKVYHETSLYGTGRCRSCSNKITAIKNWADAEFRKRNKELMFKRTGKNHPNYKGKVYKEGYVLIYNPNHPFTNNLYMLEHRLVMEKHLGRYLKPEEIVHHINGIKDDNRIKNLMLFTNKKAHMLFNHTNKKSFICKFCNKNQEE